MSHFSCFCNVTQYISLVSHTRKSMLSNADSFVTKSQTPTQVPNDMLAKLLDAYSKESGAETDFSAEDFDKVLGANVVELLFAGYNTVVNVITAGTYLFATNPSELAKLRKELDTVLKGRVPTWDDMKNLKFTRWSFFETLRIAPPAPAIARKITNPVEANGFTIPEDAEVMLPLCAVRGVVRA